MLTPRANLLKALNHQEPDWIPITCIGDNYNSATGLPPAYYAEQGLDRARALARYLDVDVLDRADGVVLTRYHDLEYTRQEAGEVITERWETPHGILTKRIRRLEFPPETTGGPVLSSAAPFEWPVKSLADYRAFAYVMEHTDYELHPEVAEQRRREVGESGIVTHWVPASPLGMCVRMYTGVEHLALAYMDHPTALRDLLEAMAQSYYRCYQAICRTAVDATIAYDDTTTQAISPTMFRELEAPFLNQAADILHAADKLCIHHACGHIRALLADFGQTRIDALDGPHPPPEGDTTLAQARAGLGSAIALMPMNNTAAMKSGDPDLIRGWVRESYQQAGSRRNFLFRVSANPPAIPIANLWLAVDEAKRLSHGGW